MESGQGGTLDTDVHVSPMSRLSLVLALGVLLSACSSGSSGSADAQTTSGAAVGATHAVPAPAVAAEESLYVGRALAVDGRIASVRTDGCALRLRTDDGPPLLVAVPRTDDGSCAWQVSVGADGFAVAAGTLRVAGDTLRLTANGVRVTPVRTTNADSRP